MAQAKMSTSKACGRNPHDQTKTYNKATDGRQTSASAASDTKNTHQQSKGTNSHQSLFETTLNSPEANCPTPVSDQPDAAQVCPATRLARSLRDARSSLAARAELSADPLG